jgi:hypothetical protein
LERLDGKPRRFSTMTQADARSYPWSPFSTVLSDLLQASLYCLQ